MKIMKKIISIVLALACAFAMFSCGGESADPIDKAIKEISDMYNAVSPSMVHTVTTRDFGSYSLVDESTLKVGNVDGYAASVLEYSNQQIRDIDSGAMSEILDPIKSETGKLEYHEDLGLRETKNGASGKWDEDGEDFAPATGANALKITKETVKDFTIDEANKTYKFTVLAENTEAVLGYSIAFDVNVVIVHSGADIISVELSYKETGSVKNHPEISVVVKAEYSYESQLITID